MPRTWIRKKASKILAKLTRGRLGDLKERKHELYQMYKQAKNRGDEGRAVLIKAYYERAVKPELKSAMEETQHQPHKKQQ